MHFLQLSTLLTLLSSNLLSNALPLLDLSNEPQFARRKAPYLVVPVDGGEPDGSPPPSPEVVTKDATKTLKESATTTIPAVTQTILSTIIVTESGTPVTIVHTQLQPSEAEPASSTPDPETIVITTTIDSTPTLTPYDLGMWHTTYYKQVEATTSANQSCTTLHSSTMAVVVPPEATPSPVLRARINPPIAAPLLFSNNTVEESTAPTTTMTLPMPILSTNSEITNPTQVPRVYPA